jgi:hypothetical protein
MKSGCDTGSCCPSATRMMKGRKGAAWMAFWSCSVVMEVHRSSQAIGPGSSPRKNDRTLSSTSNEGNRFASERFRL